MITGAVFGIEHWSAGGYGATNHRERSETMIHATARMTIPAKKLGEALEILCSVVERVRFDSGCLSCNVYRDVYSENDVMIEEVWENEKDLESHLRSKEFQKILIVAEMASAPPEIKFSSILHTTGVETIEKARSSV